MLVHMLQKLWSTLKDSWYVIKKFGAPCKACKYVTIVFEYSIKLENM